MRTRKYDTKADIYRLGVIIEEMLHLMWVCFGKFVQIFNNFFQIFRNTIYWKKSAIKWSQKILKFVQIVIKFSQPKTSGA
jgi:hypothetical protein